MSAIACLRAGALLGRRFSGLSSADALRLEEHLASCARCSRDAALLDGLRGLASAQETALPPLWREQAIRTALAQAHAEPDARRDRRWLWPAAAAAGCVAAAAFGLAFFVAEGAGPVEPERQLARQAQPAAAPAAHVDRVLVGQVEVGGALASAGSSLSELAAVRADSAAKLALGHATVELRAGTRLRWNRGEHKLLLDAGGVVADVDPRAGQRFTVETAAFSVLVLGTRFEVTPDAVRVERGRVRVIARDGTVLAESLGPGERLVVPVASTAAESAARPQDEQASAQPRRARPAADASALLAEARAQLAERRVADARRSLQAALLAAQRREQRAEAMTLSAECALVDGDLGGAIEAYLRVARAFERDPAGENALFAAARLEAERGRSAVAVTLLERYLTRHPRGRFVKEARARLRELGVVLDHGP